MTPERREYMRLYMRGARAVQRTKKRCLDCGSSRVEYRCRLCSECAQIRHDIATEISKSNKKTREATK